MLLSDKQHPAYPEAKRLESTPVPDTATNPNQKHDEKGGRRKDKGKCTDGRNSPDVHQEYCRFVQRERICRESGRRKRQDDLLKVKRMR